ncbi:MAG: magnesium transporter [Halanaerobiales bacterium]|nr:magnesium transporter [Halanaerobiales bacterium]
MPERILQLLQEKKLPIIKKRLLEIQPFDIAEFLDQLNKKDSLLIFRLLPKNKAAKVFSYLSSDTQQNLSVSISEHELKAIIKDLDFDDMIDYLEEMPANVVKKILKNTNEVERTLINQFLNYPDNSAGSLMTIEYVNLKLDLTAAEALDHIRTIALSKETIYTCFVTSSHKKMLGIVSLKDLILAAPQQKVSKIINRNYIGVNTHDDQEYIADLFKKYDFFSMPVVDNENRLVGIITIDDVVDVIDQENTEDFHKMAAIQPSDQGYLEAGVLGLAKKRIFWLLILMFSATFTGYIIRQYADLLESMVVLAAFIPMLMGTGGNAGAQSSSLVIRSLALGEVKLKDLSKVVWRELRVSFIVGLALGGLNFLRIFYLEQNSVLIAAIVSLTLLITITSAKVMGGVLPIIAKSLGIDPAIMANPLISTIVDAISLFTYFSIATWLINLV